MLKRKKPNSQRGVSLVETIIAVAILGIIGVSFLSALATTSSARATSDERISAKILAESIMEYIKVQPYAPTYEIPEVLFTDFPGYTASVDAADERNGSIQKITVTITHRNRDVLTLEGYKTDRD